MNKRRAIAWAVLFFAFALLVLFAVGNQSDLGDTVISCDVINIADKQLVFTIEGVNEQVYSEYLQTFLKNGTTIKVYQVEGRRIELDERPIEPVRLNDLRLKLIYQNEMTSAHPWLITVGQSDEDEHIEVFVGAFRATLCFPAETRPYFLEYRDGVLVRRWTGSYLNCQAFSDALYVDADGDGRDELKVVEHGLRNGKKYSEVAYYRLYGFMPYRLIMEGTGGKNE